MRYKMIISYDGTNYKGFQAQINEITIEETLNSCLSQLFKQEIKAVGSGRTDANVHAIGQVVHFDSDKEIKPDNLKNGLNSILPKDIFVKNIEIVDKDFHSRFSAKSKEYRYYISKEYNPIIKNYSAYYYNLNVGKMKEAIRYFVGTHDFTSFSFYVLNKPTIKTIFDAHINEYNDYLEIVFIGDGFLKYMVRIMVGTLIEIGLNKRQPEDIIEIFEKKDRRYAGKTAAANGLFLYKVNY